MKGKLRGAAGFTLVEIVTVIVVLGILSIFTYSFIDNAVKTYSVGAKQRMLYQETSYAMERITRELRDARNVSIDSTTGGWSITKSNVSGGLIMDSSPNVVFYRDSSNNLIRRSAARGNIIMAHNVDRFDPPDAGCASAGCVIIIQATDNNIPINDPTAKSVLLTNTVTPKNNSSGYTGRDFNGDYEDVVQ